MHVQFSSSFRPALAIAAAIGLISCGGAEEANEAAATLDSNISFERIGNDASALEAAAAAAPTLPPAETANESDTSEDGAPSRSGSDSDDEPVLGETSGGDTGGNTVQGNVSGT